MSLLVNIDRKNVMIIKSMKASYTNNFLYDNNNLTSYKYIAFNFYHNLNSNYIIENRINRGWETYFRLVAFLINIYLAMR